MNKFFLFIAFIFPIDLALAQEAYICMPLKKTGFKFEAQSRNWEQANFKTEGDKKILKYTNGAWEWNRFGQKHSFSNCNDGGFSNKSDFNSAGFIFCDTFGGSVRMSKNSLRYIETYLLGYADGIDKDPDTPLIEIGTCSPL